MMATKVVNYHHQVSYDISIMRDSIWGNPFSHMENTKAQFKVITRAEAIAQHKAWLPKQKRLLLQLRYLKGKVLGCCCLPNECHGTTIAEMADNYEYWEEVAKSLPDEPVARTLECSTAGNTALSAFNARVLVFNKFKTIEEHYQLSKIFANGRPTSIWDCKGKNAKFKHQPLVALEINSMVLGPEYREAWYHMLWLLYLDNNPSLVQFASNYDDFSDRYKSKNGLSQADVIRMYVKQGREVVLQSCAPLLLKLHEHGAL